MIELPGRRVLLVLAVLAGVGLLGGYGVAMRAKPRAEKIALDSPAPAERRPKQIFVHVGGAVSNPGLYGLPDGARVNDAVTAAGGASGDAELDALNLAAKVKDGDKVLVPSRNAAAEAQVGAAPGAASSSQSGLISINVASVTELQELPGIGPALAQRIVSYREQNGGFRTVDDLMKVSGIGPKKFEGLKDLVTV